MRGKGRRQDCIRFEGRGEQERTYDVRVERSEQGDIGGTQFASDEESPRRQFSI